MKRTLLLLVAAFAVSPALGDAQPDTGGGPPPEARAKLEQARSDAKTAGYKVLSDEHRARVQAIVEAFDRGAVTRVSDAVAQIDAVLSPDEARVVLAQRQAWRDAQRAAFAQAGQGGPGQGGPAPGGGMGQGGTGQGAPESGAPGPGGGPPQGARDGGAPRAGRFGGSQPDAGRFLLMLAADPQRYREAARAERERLRPQ